jgi:hypothetical protein
MKFKTTLMNCRCRHSRANTVDLFSRDAAVAATAAGNWAVA